MLVALKESLIDLDDEEIKMPINEIYAIDLNDSLITNCAH